MYVHTMQQPLPSGGYELVDAPTCSYLLELARTINLDTDGALITLDIAFPANTHDSLRDFPPVFEKKIHTPDQYPLRYTYYNQIQRVPKLTAHLAPVTDYTCTMQELLIIANLGGLVTAVRSVLLYKVSPFARGYLLLLQKLRAEAIANGNKPLSNLIKLMGNSMYGKFNQSNQKYLEIKLITTIEEYEKTVQSQRFVKVAFHENNCLTSQRKRYVRRDSLAIIAAHILGSSKASLLYKYHYVLKPAFTVPSLLTTEPEIRVCYIDTDCLVVYIRCHISDYTNIMKNVIHEHFDFSNLPTNHALYNRDREHLIGVVKDEVDGKTISTFHVSSAKCYKVTFTDDTSMAKCKGVPKAVSSRYTTEMYRDSALLSEKVQYSVFRRIEVTRQNREQPLLKSEKEH